MCSVMTWTDFRGLGEIEDTIRSVTLYFELKSNDLVLSAPDRFYILMPINPKFGLENGTMYFHFSLFLNKLVNPY